MWNKIKVKKQDVIYLSDGTDDDFDQLITNKLDDIVNKFNTKSKRFVYFPEIVKYNMPGEINVQPIYDKLAKQYRLDLPKHGFWFVDGWKENIIYEIKAKTEEDLMTELLELLVEKEKTDFCFSYDDRSMCIEYSKRDFLPQKLKIIISDQNVEQEIEQLSAEVREKVDRLKELGVDYAKILSLVESKPKLSRMVITEQYRIILPDYMEMEIEMRPIAKALYFLFLKHPEGIVFKDLPDYRDELYKIYSKISNLSSGEAQVSSVDAVVDPLQNTINVNCSRIKEAFYSRFTETLAEYYVVRGKRGSTKSIKLNRGLVEWQCEI